MAENVVLQLILDGIFSLETKADLDAVSNAVRDRRVLLQLVLDEEIDPLARGNSDEMIRENKERYNYNVREKDLPMAEKWYMARKPSWKTRVAYNQWRIWNVAKGRDGKPLASYKGHLITEKATGRSVSPEWESEGEEEVTEEVTEAMAAVRVE